MRPFGMKEIRQWCGPRMISRSSWSPATPRYACVGLLRQLCDSAAPRQHVLEARHYSVVARHWPTKRCVVCEDASGAVWKCSGCVWCESPCKIAAVFWVNSLVLKSEFTFLLCLVWLYYSSFLRAETEEYMQIKRKLETLNDYVSLVWAWNVTSIFDFKLSPCSECCAFSSG